MTRELRLHEEILLIALRDKRGTPESRATGMLFALGGAILCELVLGERVAVGEGEKPLVEPVDGTPLGDEVLDECLELVVSEDDRQRRASHWVSRFSAIKRLWHRVAEGLSRRGILEHSEAPLLLIFKRKAYPTIDPGPESELVERMERAINTDDELEARTAALIALCHRTGLLRVHFDKSTLERRNARLERIAEAQAVSEATGEALRASQAATVATIAATSAIT